MNRTRLAFIISFVIGIGLIVAQPKINLSTSELIAYSTVRIEVLLKKGAGTGTGFYYLFQIDSVTEIPVIVTNKHVVKGALQGRIILTGTKRDGYPDPSIKFPVIFDNFESMWIPHPDPKIDLSIMPLAPVITQAQQKKFNAFIRWFDSSVIPSADGLKQLTAVEEILMIGYPIGIWDEVNNYPIFRKGITATHPGLNYDGRDEFMIDAACYPGSSGSPVLIFNPQGYTTREGGTIFSSRIILMGILYGGPEYNAEGQISIVPIPQRQDTIALTRIPINLGNVIRSSKLLDFEPILMNIIKRSITK